MHFSLQFKALYIELNILYIIICFTLSYLHEALYIYKMVYMHVLFLHLVLNDISHDSELCWIIFFFTPWVLLLIPPHVHKASPHQDLQWNVE